MNLGGREIAENQKVARNLMQGIFDPLPHPFIALQDFVDEETIMPNKQKAPRRDMNDQNFHFRGSDLIPGFPFWEFRGAPRNSKDITNVPNTTYHKVEQSFLDLIKRAPSEIRAHIFAQIPCGRMAKDSDIDSEGHIKKSSYLMQDYIAPEAGLQFAPVKYSIRTAI
ncbi:7c83dd1c-aa6f-426b-80d9-aa673e025e7e [Sclerotinia trifoliorum]|uniref:7c83dd1c-aa6f-426b-80d9-aa673e025e7e n=1 Tax=Sclerotinia trifoliorum TaxID=28548 RepID=A0A8H2VXS0_9HELO|nr:7c83dd1c-aa6f-426b-80d9-aa673e025e7e [Sclerotinia trifoliorum]